MNKPVEPKERMDIQAILGMEASGSGWVHRRELKWAAAALAGLLLISVVWWFSGRTNSVHYVTDPVTRGGLTVIVTATGSVQPTNKVDVSSELSGTLRTVLVDYNSVVIAGQTLAELDTEKLEATVNSSRAKLAAAKAKQKDAEATVGEKERDVARKKKLVPGQAISTEDFDQSQAAYERALAAVASTIADVEAAQADLRLNESNLAKARIISPINGVVLKRSVDPGQTVASTLQAPVLFSIAEDLKQMELQVDVDEADVGKVAVGQRANFSVDAFPDRKFPASIRLIRFASETIQGVVTYKAVLSVDNSELLLRPGMTATAEIKVTEIQDALLIPNAALRYTPTATDSTTSRSFLSRLLPGPPSFRPSSPQEQTGRNRTVWALTNGEPTQVKIEIGSSDGKRTEVQKGELQVGQALIIDQTTSKP
ncbi:efflux RND transporter periplasmic adaptor subunit [Bradyrhizobium sediminis]|uniref:Efflux RND transporter periplasmic adaptor subunit n=1 Tax=Bradyrhizobium sediminis TaxID=2840469 RepID=A0A975RZJ4_9BRAD|nr:efflux RND transporter periplasmic adaptor subunit [Bradyrhizobium sediminis]QWG25288.1 efflux RND transporter periplasmic adaptor subunit [Bradyrhizobium sediminis]